MPYDTLLIQRFHHVEISSKSCDQSQLDCLCSNHTEIYQVSPDPSFAVCDTESDPRWGWFGPACKTNVDLIQCKERAEPFHTRTANEQILGPFVARNQFT